MPALDRQQIAERIALYERLREATDKFEIIEANLPVEAPVMLAVSWVNGDMTEEEKRATFVVKRAWQPLRKAMLADAQKELDDAEAAVLAFERGDEVNASE